MDSRHTLGALLDAHAVINALVEQQQHIDVMARLLCQTLHQGRQVFIIGNGGSAAEAEHIAAEFIGERVFALTNPAVLTAIGNDFGYGLTFEKQLSGLGKPGDLLLALSTSGESQNVVKAAAKAKELGMHVCALTGEVGGALAELSHVVVKVPSRITPRVQEAHLIIGHILASWWRNDAGTSAP